MAWVRVTGGLPSQHQLSRFDSMLGVVVPRRAKFDVLYSFVIREYSLRPFIELLGKSSNIFGGIEL